MSAHYSYSVSVPATTANLGPGYDSYGLALGLRNEFYAKPHDAWIVEVEGAGADTLTRDKTNLVAEAMRAVFEYCGHPDLKAAIRCLNDIPLGSGLGSSSSALVGGGKLARAMLRDIDSDCLPSDDELLAILTKLEGHPDNIAPALFGGFTVCWTDDDNNNNNDTASVSVVHCERFPLIAPIAAIIVPSTSSLATTYARSLLPEMVSHKDASFNLAHAGLLAAALTAGRVDLLNAAMKDKLHQPYRTAAVADFMAVKTILEAVGVDAVALSGAGPTIIGFVSGQDVNDALDRAQELACASTTDIMDLKTRLAPMALAFAAHGAVSGKHKLFGNAT